LWENWYYTSPFYGFWNDNMSLVNKLRAMPCYRLTVLAVFLVAAGGVCGSFFGQYVLKMNPCVMCIQQRLALVATMLLALVCIALPHRKLIGRTLAAVLISAPAAFGAWVAFCHSGACGACSHSVYKYAEKDVIFFLFVVFLFCVSYCLCFDKQPF